MPRGVGKQLPTCSITPENNESLNMDEFMQKNCLHLRYSKQGKLLHKVPYMALSLSPKLSQRSLVP
jgi:hypothetical protein